ncbi:MAG: hypothetical protein HYV28_05730 [Ignavibacteriales bacterium]|nr:hypothetical protein [Ignavibacteriales bacterium]
MKLIIILMLCAMVPLFSQDTASASIEFDGNSFQADIHTAVLVENMMKVKVFTIMGKQKPMEFTFDLYYDKVKGTKESTLDYSPTQDAFTLSIFPEGLANIMNNYSVNAGTCSYTLDEERSLLSVSFDVQAVKSEYIEGKVRTDVKPLKLTIEKVTYNKEKL